MVARRTHIAAQRARAAELDTIRLRRALTAHERAEADTLAARLYMREWRRALARQSNGHAA